MSTNNPADYVFLTFILIYIKNVQKLLLTLTTPTVATPPLPIMPNLYRPIRRDTTASGVLSCTRVASGSVN